MSTRNVTMFLFCALVCAAPCAANENAMWTWVSGTNSVNQHGVYGTKGVADPNNVPGARYISVSWIDGNDNLWLFGGRGYATDGDYWGNLNDLWKFDGTNWLWLSGTDQLDQNGVYGAKGVASPSNMPGGRDEAIGWVDSNGNLWLFGGYGDGDRNDLWKFDGTNWAWVSGSDAAFQRGVYGTKGMAASDNVPGARWSSVSWTDHSDNLWLFGGYGYAAIGGPNWLNDLWKYDGANWTWVSGSNAVGQYGVYGTKGVPGSGNRPGGRMDSVSWIDADDNLWLFGGNGWGASSGPGYLNDLWKYDGTNWTWVSGSNAINRLGVYGTKGVAAPSNTPGSRYGSVSWIDDSGSLWLFGGYGYAVSGSCAYLNDLWRFDGTNWTWVSGSSSANQCGVYGTKVVADPNNVPGARQDSVSLTDASGNLWLFGGYDTTLGLVNDLWKFGIPEEAVDMVQDGVVDELDLAVMASQWLSEPGVPSADLAPNPAGDGMVNFRDFAMLASKWLENM